MRNYIRLAWRKLIKDRSATLLNLLGLSLGVSFTIIIYLLASYLTGFDKYHPHAERIYRVISETLENDNLRYTAGVPEPLGPKMEEDFPEVQKLTNVFYKVGGLITISENGEEKKFNEEKGIAYIDTVFYTLFSRKVLEGNLKEALSRPGHAAVSQRMAKKYFGEESAISKVINLDNSKDLVVSAVMEDYGDNTHFPFDIMISFPTYQQDFSDRTDDWGSIYSDFQTYFLLKEGASTKNLESKLEDIVKKYHSDRPAGTRRYLLQPLSALHFDTRLTNFLYKTVPASSILIMTVVGFLLLATACINFINMSTAQAVRRSKEVGVRKVLGSSKAQLIWRFFSETALISFFSILVGLGIAELILIKVNDYLSVDLHITNFDFGLVTFLVITWIVMSVMSGIYPATILAGFNPVSALKNSLTSGKGGSMALRRTLVVFQFIISQLLIIGTIIICAQTRYLNQAPLGFNKDLLLIAPLPDNEKGKIDFLKTSLLKNSSIRNVSLSNSPPSSGSVWGTYIRLSQTRGDNNISIQVKMTDSSYLSTYGLKLLDGRYLGSSDTAREAVINRTLARMLNEKDPHELLGQDIDMWGKRMPIIGIVDDYHTTSLQDEISPVVMLNQSGNYRMAGIKINDRNIKETISQVESAWKQVYPQYVFSYQFLDEEIAGFYEAQQKMSHILLFFAGIALFIGCLGLYGLIAYMVNNKTKEVGIRKALGATIPQVVNIFLKEFFWLVVIAFVIAAPLGYFLMRGWLNQFAYRVNIQIWMFGITLLLAWIITLITVGYKSLNAARANPVISLRNE